MAKSAHSQPLPVPTGNPLRTTALVLLTVSTLLSAWLALQSVRSGSVPGCDAGNCAIVLTSKWSKVFGVPVGLFGAATYAILAILGLKPLPANPRGPRIAAAALVLMIPAAGLWFASLQLFVLHAFCPWCSATHAVATTGAILMAVAWKKDRGANPETGRKGSKSPKAVNSAVWGAAATYAALAFAGFLVAQVLSPEPPRARIRTASMESPAPQALATGATVPTPTTDAKATTSVSTTSAPASTVVTSAVAAAVTPAGPRRLTLHGGKFQLDPLNYPVIGSPTARHLVVMISDYTCRYCRAAHKMFHEVRESFDASRLGIVMLPSHHGGDSEAIQRMMLATWKVDPGVWAEVADDLYAERIPLKPQSLRPILEQRLGADRLAASTAAHESWITNVFGFSREIYTANRAKAGSGSIPQFIFGQEIIVGAPADAAEIYQLLDKNLGLVRDRLPELQLAASEVDLGRVFAGTMRSLAVAYSNPGQAPLQVTRAVLPPGGRPGRGFMTPVAPGQTSSVEVSFAVPKEDGPFNETVTFHSNGRQATAALRVKGTSWKPLRITPQILDFGKLDADNAVTQSVMRIELAEEATIESIRSQNPGFKATLREVTPKRSYEIDVATTENLGTGPQQGVILVSLKKPVPQDWPESIAVAARATIERAVTVVPPRLIVPSGVLTSERHHQFLVRCQDSTPDFAVTEAVLEGGPAFTQPQISRTGKDFTVQLTLPAGWSLPKAPTVAKLTIHTSHPRFPTLDVPITAQP
ncbi:MAG: DUF1573 domain-containing protein [Verrucomicrobiales bacterium]|nr:DUF1573 domain-containing protein [Verrucomicrobiales bacterium]